MKLIMGDTAVMVVSPIFFVRIPNRTTKIRQLP